MKIGVIGAGFAGLASAYFLRDHAEVFLFDPDYTKSASFAATGLMHPYPGKFPRRSKYAYEALKASLDLMREIEEKSGQKFYEKTGLFRPAMFSSQEKIFSKLSKKYEDVSFWSESEVQKHIPDLAPYPGMFIHSGVVVHCPKYIESLLICCKQKGVQFVPKQVCPEGLKSFDQVVICAGSLLPLDPIKGQMLIVRAERSIPFPICGMGHITPFSTEFWIGSTYERDFDSHDPDEKANRLLSQISKFYPPAANFEILETRAGIRYANKNSYLPFMKRVGENLWGFSGLGSRGLLYHALYAQTLTSSLSR